MSTHAPTTLDAIDLRTIAPRERHALVFSRFDALLSGQSMQLDNDHDPSPLRRQLEERALGPFDWTPLAAGPDVWRVLITRVAVQPAPGLSDSCCGGGACCG